MQGEVICGCKGIRSCLVCKPEISKKHAGHDEYVYCPDCHMAWPGQSHRDDLLGGDKTHDADPTEVNEDGQKQKKCRHVGDAVEFPGVFILPDFVSEEEEDILVAAIDESPWKPSQSGRVKQDYGPRVNFKRRKLKCDGFTGLPSFSKPIVDKLVSVPILADFKPVEQCHLEYIPHRGSSIDPHIDDTWLWGERLVTINLLSKSYLLMTPYEPSKVSAMSGANQRLDSDINGRRTRAVKLLMPRRSLIVLYGEARYNWEHAIPREAVTSRRIAVTLRELTPHFMDGGEQATIGKSVLETALSFKGTVLN